MISGKAGEQFLQKVALFMLSVAFLVVPIGLFTVYVFSLFPHIPVELGGPSSRCVELDLATDRLSAPTLAALSRESAGASGTSPPPVIRSRPLELVFEGSSFSLLRAPDADDAANFRLSSGTVLVSVPCR